MRSRYPSPSTSLLVTRDDEIIFQSDGKWLYPLFDLEDHLNNTQQNLRRTIVWDKVIGKASALLLTYLKAERVHGELISDLAFDVFEHFQIPLTYDQRVPRIKCKTEMLLLDINDPDQAYQILSKRAKRC